MLRINTFYSKHLFIITIHWALFEMKLYLVKDSCRSFNISVLSSLHRRNLTRFLLTSRCLRAKMTGLMMDLDMKRKLMARWRPNTAWGWRSAGEKAQPEYCVLRGWLLSCSWVFIIYILPINPKLIVPDDWTLISPTWWTEEKVREGGGDPAEETGEQDEESYPGRPDVLLLYCSRDPG